MKAHAFLPYRERHMEVLSCAVCHASGLMGPAAEMIDATVVTAAGAPGRALPQRGAARGRHR